MGLFSSPKSLGDLAPSVQQALSSTLREDGVGQREYQRALKEIVQLQNSVLQSIPQGEQLKLLIPCFKIDINGNAHYEGMAAFTNRTILHFGGRPFKMPMADVAEVERKVNPDGYFTLVVISHAAIPYAPFRAQFGHAATKFWAGTMTFNVADPATIEHVAGVLDSLRQNQ